MTAETSNARGKWVLVPRVPTKEMVEAICSHHGSGEWPDGYGKLAQAHRRADAVDGYRAMLAAAPPPAAARGDVRGLVAQWQECSCGFSDPRGGYESCPECGAALAAEGVQAGEVEQRARELLDARVIDSLINANQEIHTAAAELASCLASAVAAGATDIPLTHRAGMALKKYESLTELSPKDEARGRVECPTCGAPAVRSEREGVLEIEDVYRHLPDREESERLDWLADQMRIADLQLILGSTPLDAADLRAAIDVKRAALTGERNG